MANKEPGLYPYLMPVLMSEKNAGPNEKVRRKTITFPKYTPIKKEIEIYDITGSYLKNNPRIVKIFGEFIDITEMFFDLGFKQYQPSIDFFENSNNISSKWNIFYKPMKINIGYSYKELLEEHNVNDITMHEVSALEDSPFLSPSAAQVMRDISASNDNEEEEDDN